MDQLKIRKRLQITSVNMGELCTKFDLLVIDQIQSQQSPNDVIVHANNWDQK
jgi:hypothetical protein